ncbi:conserved hypothetical protein [Pseudomonas veronii]|uniref:hypothetical protein n=1 Tax=Pseudomonas veronii TaxID=76761 RepID=UPI001759B33E|nr:hypothetical protein [Pseudomonas veronii]CAD0266031.1 conserved hypothetical protein [Pseudomonas veronii]
MSMLTLVTDQREGEPDILTPGLDQAFEIRSLEGAAIVVVDPPAKGWTHDQLMSVSMQHEEAMRHGADAFLGGVWIGSTEV